MAISLLEVSQVGQTISGLSFFITAAIAATTLFSVNRKQMDDEWLNSFRVLYAEFWNNPRLIQARSMIVNKPGYDQLRLVLVKRNGQGTECNVTPDEYELIEQIDAFCATMARVRSFANSVDMTDAQIELWGDLLFNYWIEQIKHRPELKSYVEVFWRSILADFRISKRRPFFLF